MRLSGFWGKRRAFFEGWAFGVCGVSGCTEGGNEFLDRPAGPGGEAGGGKGLMDVCVQVQAVGPEGYLAFLSKYGFWERM